MGKMDRASSQFAGGDRGIGRILFSNDGRKVQVKMTVKKDKVEEEKKFLLDIDNCPDNIALAKKAKLWAVRMNQAGDKLLSFTPAMGNFIVKVKSFPSKEGEEPKPKLDENYLQRWNTSIEKFLVMLEIVEPKELKGLEIPYFLRYQFAPKQTKEGTIAQFSMGGKYTEELESFMDATGLLDDKYMPYKYVDNLLPLFQRNALHEDRKFQVTLKDGYVLQGTILPLDDPEEDVTFDDFDEPVEELNERIDEITTSTDEIPFEVDEEIESEDGDPDAGEDGMFE
jgi:hypothetical protein